jgi:exoribonuclease II
VVRRLKFRSRSATTAAIQLLAALQWRRTTQGAFDLLVGLGAWQVHEDTALLRSGFPLSFSKEEEMAAQQVAAATAEQQPSSIPDVDDLLGLRQDLTHLKVYTIDGASTSEIDDGVSLEKVTVEEVASDGTTSPTKTRIRQRLWVHIADADHWAPRGSQLLEAARKRITSLYLPTNHISMFPLSASTQIMSLRAGGHGHVLALSLGVMLDDTGAVDTSSIIVTPSKIRVTYRLTYDEVDELLEEGTGCREEWQLGAMLEMATLRRAHRIAMGSSEGLTPNPIPYSSVHVHYDSNDRTAEPDISIMVEMSHNAGKNKTTEVCLDEEHDSNGAVLDVAPVSSANLLVTEAMILACEALPRWKLLMDETDALAASSVEKKSEDIDNDDALSVAPRLPNQLRLPFRTQPKPDFKARARERRVLQSLREDNVGNGLCYAWYIRRFLEPVKISETPSPHSGLGLDCYVQWSSPIRRFSDLQVHASVKRYLRRKRIQQLLLSKDGESISTLPEGIEPSHLGWPEDALADKENGGLLANVKLTTSDLDQDMDFLEGIGLIGAARTIQRQSQQYWMFEYIRRLQQKKSDSNMTGSNKVIFRAVVLGCIDPERQQYAIYVPELGLEHRYVSPIRLDPGKKLNLAVDTVFPRTGLLTFVRVM